MAHKDRVIVKKMKPMLTVQEASRLLHVHINTLRRWNNHGIIRGYRIGPRGDRRFSQDDIACSLSQLELNGGDPLSGSSSKLLSVEQ
ncbi:helix-turn-helix domain-containing protein [Chloroflexota bacterium]